MVNNIEKYTVAFYNRLSGDDAEEISQIPRDVYLFLRSYSYLELITPFVTEDLRGGMSRDQIQIKYSVKPHFARQIGRRIGVYKKKTKKLSVPQRRKKR